jgi:hypothetical protein
MNRVLLFVSFLFVSATLNAQRDQKITTFDVPSSDGINTTVTAISQSGNIVGYYQNTQPFHLGSNPSEVGFLRTPDGKITTFQFPPSAATTFPTGVNSSGMIIGGDGGGDAFIGTAKGPFTEFNPPRTAMYASAINDSGEIVGQEYVPLPGSLTGEHSFLRSPTGAITTFDPSSATSFSEVGAINQAGECIGSYDTPSIQFRHGFLREPDGTVKTFDIINAIRTEPSGIDNRGRIVGDWADSQKHFHGFVRDVDGNITTIDYPGALDSAIDEIESNGRMLGGYRFSSDIPYSPFVRDKDGKITPIEIPGATRIYAVGILPNGEVIGSYTDSTGEHGYIMKLDHDDR